MTGRGFIDLWLDEAEALGLTRLERVLLTLALALLAAAGPVALRALAKVKTQVPEWDPERGTGNLMPPLPMPEGGIPVPPKEWREGEP